MSGELLIRIRTGPRRKPRSATDCGKQRAALGCNRAQPPSTFAALVTVGLITESVDEGVEGAIIGSALYKGAFTLPEALWLWERGMRDIVVAYPTADRASLARLARLTSSEPEPPPVLMVDSLEQLELTNLTRPFDGEIWFGKDTLRDVEEAIAAAK